MLIIDSHLDLAYNGLVWNRDLTQSIRRMRETEAGMEQKGRSTHVERRLGLPNSNPPRHQRLCRARPRCFRAHLVARFRPSALACTDASIIERRPALFFLGHISPIFAPFFLVFSRFSPS